MSLPSMLYCGCDLVLLEIQAILAMAMRCYCGPLLTGCGIGGPLWVFLKFWHPAMVLVVEVLRWATKWLLSIQTVVTE